MYIIDVHLKPKGGATVNSGRDELVSVMVPRQFVTQVYGLIAQLDGGQQARAMEETVRTGDDSEEWTPARLRRMVEESAEPMRDILSALAARPGEWLSAEELAKAIRSKPNADWNTIAGTLGAFGRRLKSRYGLDTWPFEDRYDHEAKGRHYRMSATMAKRIKELLTKR